MKQRVWIVLKGLNNLIFNPDDLIIDLPLDSCDLWLLFLVSRSVFTDFIKAPLMAYNTKLKLKTHYKSIVRK